MRNSPSAAAVLLDRDGVINENRSDYVKSWEEFLFLDGALSALGELASSPFRVAVVTNQSAINRNLVARHVVEDINKRMVERIAQAGGRIDQVFYCPHRPDEGCECRKPRPGLILQASRELDFDLNRSFLVGDSAEDVVAARASGCMPILVQTGRGARAVQELLRAGLARPITVPDLVAAVNLILRHSQLMQVGW